ncbi:MAG: hypothetical protein HY360_17160 [Verrucomicrobia bacterium]|nr:hypothetical protein [Verrucomicrobiota bacterium]
MKQENYFDQIVGSFQRRRPKPHTPRFRIAKERLGWRVFDGEKAIALLMPMQFDIWSFSPFEPDKIANVEPPGKVVDLHTLHNTAINLGTQGWPRHWHAQGDFENRVKWNWLKKGGKELLARITVSFADGESGQWRLRVRYDPAWGRYRYTWDIAARKYEPDSMEGFNLMMAGALADRAEHRRWTHSIWENPDGELRRIVHSNALFSCTDYASGVKFEADGPWRWRNASYPRAWIGYAAHPSFNPVMLVHRTNVPLMFGTCSQLFDEHFRWMRAGQDNLDADGYFHFQMSAELVNLSPALAKDFLRQGKDPMRPKRWCHDDFALPFYVDRVNPFAEEIDPWKPEECAILKIPRAPNGPIVWDQNIGRDDRYSIRLQNSVAWERRELWPQGAVCRVRPHHRYRLSGWIKSRGVKRFARLELLAYEYTYANVTAFGASAQVSGTRGWTRVEAEVDSGDSVYVMPKLVLYGPGTAWFDDVRMEKISKQVS